MEVHPKCTQNSSKLEGPKQQYPVLLLNGYSTESYWLPTEPNDLVRTLLEEGHDIWLLQPIIIFSKLIPEKYGRDGVESSYLMA
jgi:hypothetical protein